MKKLAAFCLAVLLTACASAPVYQLSEEERSRYAKLSAETLVNNLRASMLEAREARLDYYAPAAFALADKSLAEADKLYKDKSEQEKLVPYVAAADDALARARASKETALKVLANELKLDSRLQELGAPADYANEYKALAGRLVSLIAALEKEPDASRLDKDRHKLGGDLEALKIRITKRNALAEVQALLKTLKDKGASERAPKAMQDAVAEYARAEAFIQTNSDDAPGIEKAATAAVIMARRAQWMEGRVQALQNLEDTQFENTVLEEERWMAALSAALPGGELRDQMPLAQAEALAKRATALRAELETSRQALGAAESESAGLRARVAEVEGKAGKNDTRVAELTKQRDSLLEKVGLLENSVGVLKSQLAVLQNLLTPTATAPTPTTPTTPATGAEAKAATAPEATPASGGGAAPAAQPEPAAVTPESPAPVSETAAEVSVPAETAAPASVSTEPSAPQEGAASD